MRTKIWSRSPLITIALLTLVPAFAPAEAATKLKLFILSGQSNSVGIAFTKDLPPELQKPQTNVKFYPMGQTTGKVYVGWTTLRPGLWCDASHNCSEVGSYITFGRDMALAMPNDSLAIFLLGNGAVTLGNEWRSPSSGGAGSLYNDLITGLRQAITDLGSGYQVEIAGMLWMQGESDAMDQNLANIVRPKEDAVARTDTNVGILDTYGLPKNTDGGHYNARGHMILGSSFAASMLRLLKNPARGPLVEPSDLVARTLIDGKVKLLLRDNSTGETGFKVERKDGNGAYAEIGSLSTGSAVFDSCVDNSTASSMIYSYKVKAINSSSSSAYSNEATVFPRGAGNGLKAQYFSDTALKTLVLSRVDTTINFTWNGAAPATGLSTRFSARWSGFIQPRYTDEYAFFMASDMSGRVWIDNKLVVDQWQWDYVPDQIFWPVHAGTIKLTAGQSYSIKVEYYVDNYQSYRSHAILKWQSINYYQEMQVVPKSQLYQDVTGVRDDRKRLSLVAEPQQNPAGISLTANGRELRLPGLSDRVKSVTVSDVRGRIQTRISEAGICRSTTRPVATGISFVTVQDVNGTIVNKSVITR